MPELTLTEDEKQQTLRQYIKNIDSFRRVCNLTGNTSKIIYVFEDENQETVDVTVDCFSTTVDYGALNFEVQPNASMAVDNPIFNKLMGQFKITYDIVQDQAGGANKYQKTSAVHTGKNGVTHVVYTKNNKSYIKRKTSNGTFKYVPIKV